MLEDFIVQSNQAQSGEDLFNLFEQQVKNYGYDRVIYCLLTDHLSLGLNAQHGVFSTYPNDWLEHYKNNAYHRTDPVLRKGYTAASPFLWEDVSNDPQLSTDAKKVMNEAQDAKLYNGIGIPIRGSFFEIAGFGIASSEKNVDANANTLCILHFMSLQFYTVINSLISKIEQNKPVKLTKREQDILLWATEGKSDSVIADILGIRHSTVRFHFKNIFAKLQVNERTLAVVKAIRLGLIIPQTVRTPLNLDSYQTDKNLTI